MYLILRYRVIHCDIIVISSNIYAGIYTNNNEFNPLCRLKLLRLLLIKIPFHPETFISPILSSEKNCGTKATSLNFNVFS